MQKININIIDNLINHSCSSSEIDIILYLSRIQNEFGQIRNVYYKDVILDLGISAQTFYNSIYHLNDLEIIVVDFTNTKFWNIRINNNIYSRKNSYRKAYINTNTYNFLYSRDFRELPAGAKYLVLKLLKVHRSGQSFPIGIDKIKEYSKVYSNTVALKYINLIMKWFSIHKTRNDIFYITLRKDLSKSKYSEWDNMLMHKIKMFCALFKVGYSLKDLNDLLDLFHQYGKKHYSRLIYAIEDTCMRYHCIQPKLINTIVNQTAF